MLLIEHLLSILEIKGLLGLDIIGDLGQLLEIGLDDACFH
jgi:hypothetical protein